MSDDIEEGDVPNTSQFGLLMAKPNNSEELTLLGKNDDHLDSMTKDESFMAQVKERNAEANQLMNLNNAELTKAGDNAAQNADVLIANTNEDWINRKWRPMMAWLYMTVCLFDFIIFPILWSLAQANAGGSITTPWQPITLQGAGLFHVAMGAVLGIATYGRTQEKLQNATVVNVPNTVSKP